jgi:hypothetical protein
MMIGRSTSSGAEAAFVVDGDSRDGAEVSSSWELALIVLGEETYPTIHIEVGDWTIRAVHFGLWRRMAGTS